MKKLNFFLFALLSILALAACAPKTSLQVEGAWARAAGLLDSGASAQGGMAAGTTSAAFLTISNQTGQTDRLLSAECDAARAVELHETRMENDIMAMRQVSAIDIPAGASVELKPGGYHIMLIDLSEELKAGQKLALTLVFENAGRVAVEAEIRAP